ncbi:hypothetical protein RND81_06G041700 [Saponaria officinalis]|uniref:Uncharacterized protein n=1 Tax=Saponaria officinalis TaxID=3572 RepID=A0AAW1K3S6_SAPOF
MGEINEEGMLIENGCEVEDEIIPKMMIRVLLVEADDSTRQILTALLRKCNYKVAAIADGLQAWEILKKRHNNIDLVLTELDLPSISGYALLTLIMEHDACKNIPVIMMSSQDSISMVLKCILKGAADFLIKPVRKNELKNLWRHVWRRLPNNDTHNPQNLTTNQQKIEATYENIPATNHSGDDVSTSRKSSKCFDKATDAEGLSWTKCSEETGLSNKETENNPKGVKSEKELALLTSVAERKAAKSESGDQSNDTLSEDEKGSSTGLATEDESAGQTNYRRKADTDDFKPYDPCRAAMDLIGSMKRQKCVAAQPSYIGDFSNLDSTPELELTLRRVHDSETKELDERPTLNHSNSSAFSWYNRNTKSQTASPFSINELTEAKDVADATTFNSIQDDKSVAGGAQSDVAPMSGVVFDQTSAKTQNSAVHREESPFLTSPSLHSDQTEPEFRNSGSQTVNPSCSSTFCGEFVNEKTVSARGSTSDLNLDSVANGPATAGTSVVKEPMMDNVGKTTEPDLFRHRSSHQSAQREAALAKFRLKRKDRCYEKKVRYQSRKKLAEQRVRVKGQFVRQVPTPN